MRPLGHTVISLAAGSILYNYGHSARIGLASFLIASIFLDLDHYIDYVREHGVSLDFKKICNAFRNCCNEFKRVTIFLHSYEVLILFWLCIFMFDLGVIWKYCAIGFTLHLLIDQIVNPMVPLAYFLSFRIATNFETEKIFTKAFIKQGGRS
ncbi:hypothetical protein ACFL28_05255 [Candidatus Omnitrophota bacterium]